jgi:hypothetical protein
MGTPPFQHAGGKNLLAGAIRVRADLVKQGIQRLTRPKGAVKHIRLGAGFAILDDLVDNHRPAPDRGCHQHDHDDFDGNRGARE